MGKIVKKFISLFLALIIAIGVMPGGLYAPMTTWAEGSQPDANSISGFMWLDGNGMLSTDWDGYYNGNEPPLDGFPVYLYDASDLTVVIAQTTTGWDGTYTFDNLEPGDYAVGIEDTTISAGGGAISCSSATNERELI